MSTAYANELKSQMALKEGLKAAEKLHDRVSDFHHIDTVENFSPYGKYVTNN